MIGAKSGDGLVLGFHPTARGFGWVVFAPPFTPLDWGLVSARKDKNAISLRRLEALLDRFEPQVLVLEAYDRRTTRRAQRVAQLCAQARLAAQARDIETVVYSLAEIRTAFAEVGAVTRRDVAEAVARHVDAFRHRLPPPRKPWESEDSRSALFAAAAVGLTHLRLSL